MNKVYNESITKLEKRYRNTYFMIFLDKVACIFFIILSETYRVKWLNLKRKKINIIFTK